jgi:uncharacterized protein YbbC (DUF1343 family)
MRKFLWLLWIGGCSFYSLRAQPMTADPAVPEQRIIPGAERMDLYLALLKGKRVGVFANQTSRVGGTHLVDTLRASGINVVRIFSPEHGFRGDADAGEKVNGYRDSLTGVDVVSLYGNHVKPTTDDINDVDILLFDIQDVGVRFYTYMSSLQYLLQAAVDNHKPLVLLDRPNPNGFYIDGPVLDRKFSSFVGLQSIPVVYGMTLGEYARMLLGEGWVKKGDTLTGFQLTVIPCGQYTHRSLYSLPVKPSPNLPDMQSVYLYPSLCWFEGTVISLGRGTDKPFQVFGHPLLPATDFSFTPHSIPGAKNPPLKDQACNGYDLSTPTGSVLLQQLQGRLQIKWLLEAYRLFPDKSHFFNDYFNKLAGTDQLSAQIIAGLSESDIRKSWEPGLAAFKAIRAKYLIYPE